MLRETWGGEERDGLGWALFPRRARGTVLIGLLKSSREDVRVQLPGSLLGGASAEMGGRGCPALSVVSAPLRPCAWERQHRSVPWIARAPQPRCSHQRDRAQHL